MEHAGASLLTDIGLSIGFAALAAHAMRVLRQPVLLGYVLAGAVLGSHFGFALVEDPKSIELISEIGLILLLFIIGLEIDLREVAGMGRAMFVVGVVQFVGSLLIALVAFAPLGFAIGGGRFDLLYIAVALSLSSTLIVVKLLHDKFEVHTAAGRLTVGVLVLQDLWAILFMTFQPNLLQPAVGRVLASLAQGALLVGLAFFLSNRVLSRLYRAAGKTPEVVLLTSVAWCFLLCGLADLAGLSREMGALIAGLSISASPYGADVVAKIAGVRDFFVTLFFVALGLQVPAPSLSALSTAVFAILVVIVSRLVSIVPVARLAGLGLRTGTVTALNLSQVSEFSLVILALGASYGHIPERLRAEILLWMLLASLVSTYLILFNDAISRLLIRAAGALGLRETTDTKGAPGEAGRREPDILVLGCYREGAALLDEIERRVPSWAERIVVVDYNPDLDVSLRQRGFRLAYGDLAHPETLQHLGVEAARVVVCAVSDTFLKGTTSRRLLAQLRTMATGPRIIMVADDQHRADELLREGADRVVVTSALGGRRLFEELKDALRRH